MAAAGSLGTAIRARLDQLGLPARRFTAAGFISAATLSRVFAGQDSLRDPARAAELERGLGWRAGSINAVRSGRAPSAIRVAGWPRPDGDWRSAVEAAWTASESNGADGGSDDQLVDPARVAELVDFLFATVHPHGGDELRPAEVAERVASAGRELSEADVKALRSGKRVELDRLDAQALAGVFGVPTSYFFDPVDTERVKRQLTTVTALRDQGVERIALRSIGLSEGSRKAVEDMIEHLRELEGPDSE